MSRARAAAIAALLITLAAALFAARLGSSPQQTSAPREARGEGARARRSEARGAARPAPATALAPEPREEPASEPQEDIQQEPVLTRGEILEETDLLLDREGEIERRIERLASCFEEWEAQRESLSSMREEIVRTRRALEQTPRDTLEGASEALSGRLELWHTRLDEVQRSAERWPHQEGCE